MQNMMKHILHRPIHHCCRRAQYMHHPSPTTHLLLNRPISTLSTTHRHTHQSILPNIHPQHFYQIINNVNEYRNFLPYCQESKILQVSQCGSMMDAVLTVGLPGLSVGAASSLLEERYVSRVRMLQPKMIGGNVVEKEGCWNSSYSLPSSTTNNTHSCNVRFEVEIQVSNPLISFTLDRVLNDVARKQVEAFEKRCRNVSFDAGGR
ncbi:hypothetical protein THAPSDRAFT_269976 [Thalassiosira pseudonana CCMP1335]|uniref:Coenzyme Q-binding protein COQ10 START domain-containing protein n=1 Tax=Thalassiosira pseudonana TaxID=35128 RepID=B8LD45_THAPS|nr:hypothetical protein THAPSDRAFT_269976 [Thalassiosira pseudonana CCMP1335]EED86745.1 hypothetical protein THAPSDRAFT_269976 [Thalassiosira pseudonana CCMP1335]